MELLVVIALMALLMISAFGAWSWLNSGDIKKSSRNIDSLMSYTRTNSMAMNSEWVLKIEKEGKHYYGRVYKDGTLKKEAELGSRLTIYRVSESGTETEIKTNSDTWAEIKYKMSTGGAVLKEDDIAYKIVGPDETVRITVVKLTGIQYVEYE